jgi:predicted nucleotidyltransferase component of viral defense system
MIQQSFIMNWAARAPWQTLEQVEQDLVISRALVSLFSSPIAQDHLVFRGGTALNKLFFNPPERYSEDIDLVQIIAGPIGTIIKAIRDALDPWLGEPNRDFKEGRVVLRYGFISENNAIPMKLKVEINSREHFSIFGVKKMKFQVDSQWFKGEADIPVYSLEELLATKLKALYERRKGRDLFDIDRVLNLFNNFDVHRLIIAYKQHLDFEGRKISQPEFLANLALKIQHPGFRNDIRPLLPLKSERYSPEDAYENVVNKVIKLL